MKVSSLAVCILKMSNLITYYISKGGTTEHVLNLYYLAIPIRLSPLGMVSVCPGGQLLLTCERMSGFILVWDISVPRMPSATTQRIVLSQEELLSPEFNIGFTELNITRTSDSPLISQLLISNVTTEINGSTIYCSEDGDENNAPMTVINVTSKSKTCLLCYF